MSVTSACSKNLPEPEVHVHDLVHLLQLGQTLDCLREDPGVVCLKEQPLTVNGSPITVTPGKLQHRKNPYVNVWCFGVQFLNNSFFMKSFPCIRQ